MKKQENASSKAGLSGWLETNGLGGERIMAMPRHERNFICIGHECHRELAEYVVFSLDALAEVE